MRSFLTLLLFLLPFTLSAQDITSLDNVIIDSGKVEFKLQYKSDKADYSKAIRMLTNQVKAEPKNAELHYYLGYALDKFNTNDGNDIHKMSLPLTRQSSEQFEEVIRLEPEFKGEIFILDPYSKITSVWGSLAMAYMHRKQTDSAVWALKEGKKRGGFIEPALEYGRQMMSSCDKDAILVTYGDLVTYGCLYLQLVEQLRTDVAPLDVNLLNTKWYPHMVKDQGKIAMDYEHDELDSVEWVDWSIDTVHITDPKDSNNRFYWELRATYQDAYLLRSDVFLFNILYENYFRKPFCYNTGSDSSYNLFLAKYFTDQGLVDRVNFTPAKNFTVTPLLKTYNLDKMDPLAIKRSPDVIKLLSNYRWTYVYNIYRLHENNEIKQARALLAEMDRKFPMSKLPNSSELLQEYIDDIRSTLSKK